MYLFLDNLLALGIEPSSLPCKGNILTVIRRKHKKSFLTYSGHLFPRRESNPGISLERATS